MSQLPFFMKTLVTRFVKKPQSMASRSRKMTSSMMKLIRDCLVMWAALMFHASCQPKNKLIEIWADQETKDLRNAVVSVFLQPNQHGNLSET